ncbi:MAG: thiamine-monophosphate kinase [Candidatus Aureabacteria bacterium]|nr:thiamine-monophosphate kinase [Candidatus Auribacterota bacterium]
MKLDEFGLIDKFARMTKPGTNVIVGIGDDAAVLKSKTKGFYDLFTCDAIVEDVHFKLADGARKIGYKAVAVNVSDIAAMGGIPSAAVVAAGISKKISTKFCEEIYSGILFACRKFGVEIVGGDTVRSKGLFISIAMTGVVEKGNITFRKGAAPGDTVMVTGRLGHSLKGKHLTFIPRIKEARWLACKFPVHSMMDISDGLAGDLKRMCDASKCGAVIFAEKVPIERTLKKPRKNVSLKHAFTDGEDFELLFTVSPRVAAKLEKDFNRKFKVKVSKVGVIIKGEKLFLESEGKKTPLKFRGYSHFG